MLTRDASGLIARRARELSRRHLFALGVMALLVSVSFGVLQRVIVNHEDLSEHVLHVVGRQRMLSEQLCKAALLLISDRGERNVTRYRHEIEDALARWEESHAAILRGPLLAEPRQLGVLSMHMQKLQLERDQMASAARALLTRLSSSPLPEHAVAEEWPDLDALLAHKRPYLAEMEQTLQIFVLESAVSDHQARRLSILLGLALLLTLGLQALLIFRPVLRQLADAVGKLDVAWGEVLKRERALRTLLAALPDLIVSYSATGVFIATHGGNDTAASQLAEVFGERSIEDLFPASQAAAFRQALERVSKTHGSERLSAMLQVHGELRYVELRFFQPGHTSRATDGSNSQSGETDDTTLASQEVFVLIRDVTAQRVTERRILEAVDAAQQRIGSDIHDSVSQTMTGLNMVLESSLATVKRGGAVAAAELLTCKRFIDQSVADLRRIVRGLVPQDLDALGLAGAIRRMVNHLAALSSIEVNVEVALDDYEPPLPVALQLYRIVQEAVSNAVRHAAPKSISVSLVITTVTENARHDRELMLQVIDDGIGIRREKSRNQSEPRGLTGLGLRTMAYRAQCVGASLRIEPAPEQGTIVRCLLPLDLKQQPALRMSVSSSASPIVQVPGMERSN